MYILQVLLMIVNVIIIIWNCVNLYKLHKINKEIEQEQKALNEGYEISSEFIMDEEKLKELINRRDKALLIYDECGDPDKKS